MTEACCCDRGCAIVRREQTYACPQAQRAVFRRASGIVIVVCVIRHSNETWLVHYFFGSSSLALGIMRVCALSLMLVPVLVAWRTITNRHKLMVFLLLFIGVPITVFFLVGIVLEELIITRHVLAETVWGMPYMVLLAELLATIGYATLTSYLWTPSESSPTIGVASAHAAAGSASDGT
jgi:hypothetical protein